MPTIRRAGRDDISLLAATLASAFDGYPWTDWAVPEDDHQSRLEAIFTHDMADMGLAHDEVWMTDDAASVAVWIPPKEQQTAEIDWEAHGQRVVPLFGDRLARIEAGDALIMPLRPKRSCWYLATLGTRPDRQGEGLGRAVLAPVLARCDAEGFPALTETTTLENVRFYERLGFVVLHEVTLPEDGPPLWILWREPQSASDT
jgi:GNAT superfamily N-acetyltransferase